ncbi:MAG: DUF4349 domain-containing protein, partial [Dehalococcoidia bacterium]|nr:DUF4349 domain-containing protein [Dehalococcoidia bacterium]
MDKRQEGKMKKALLAMSGLLVLAALAWACGSESDGASADRSDDSGEARDGSSVEFEEQAAPEAAIDSDQAAAEGQESAGGTLPFDRQIIQSATIEIEVEEVIAEFSAVSRIASAAGGYVSSSNVHHEGED